MSVNFNESFKALVREVFQEKSNGVINILDEVVSNKASEDTKHINNLKELAIKDIKSEIATNDFVRAEIAELKQEFKQDIAELKQDMSELRAEFKQDIAEVKQDMSELRAELKQDMSELRAEFKQDIAEVKNEVSDLKAEVKDEIAKSKVDIIKWIVGLQLACIGMLVGLLKLIF